MKTKNPEPLYVQFFQQFDIEYNSKSILNDNRGTAKIIDLLKYLLTHNGMLISCSTIVEDLWPDNDYIDEKKVIQTYIYRLRGFLNGNNILSVDLSSHIQILHEKGNYKAEISKEITFDTEQFETLCNQLDNTNDPKDLLTGFETFIKLYKGHFLQNNADDLWTAKLRNYYLRIYCNSLRHILEVLSINGLYQDVIRICEKSFSTYDLDENQNIYFLRALIQNNQLNNALRHYSYITGRMYSELSMSPSERLKQVYNEIKSAENHDELSESGINEEKVREMISDALRSFEVQRNVQCAIAQITVQNRDNEDVTDYSDILKKVFMQGLRKNDMFVITGKQKGIVVLSGAKEEYFEAIKSRLVNSFRNHITNRNLYLEIEVYPATNIL